MWAESPSSILESTGQGGERKVTQKTALDHSRWPIMAATPFMLWRPYLTPTTGKLILPQLLVLELPCPREVFKPVPSWWG